MILESHTPAALADDMPELQASADFVGDASELNEITITVMTEMHNLTIAMARFEHNCLVENDQTLMEGAIKEFFAKGLAALAGYWKQFIAWLGSMWTKLKDAFVKREEWLTRNKSVIESATDEQLKGTKANIGKNVLATSVSGLPAKSVAAAKSLITEAINLNGPVQDFKSKVIAALRSPLKSHDAKKSAAADIHDNLIGENAEIELTASIVKDLVGKAIDSFRAIDEMKGAKMVAESALKATEGNALMNGVSGDKDKEIINARINTLREVGTAVQTTITAYAGAISAINGQVMPVLVKVAGIAGKKEDKKEDKKEEVNAGTSLLSAYM